MKPDEIRKLDAYLKRTFSSADIKVKPLPKQAETAEVYVADEFVGTLTKDTDEGELSYHLTMTILDIDLE
ncbi:DUF3126 family protein [Fulvimarina sp. 2208YS6-2-32]|uniref:DUF3126 family protein n=1 Tax=Fulvimarina uroteuthidis TaxID=3098149 RepID=A0ABU5I3P7_9HYPH|nr:DUF3126 family protein [Fulvimarina sp. 2208YS6-2-32]MDY8109705.1 DUF3126 family protein [Fulvimarina sp. 2208YS6-2-32]